MFLVDNAKNFSVFNKPNTHMKGIIIQIIYVNELVITEKL